MSVWTQYERQSERRETVELMETLDTQWEDVRGLIYRPVRRREREIEFEMKKECVIAF